ncbi:DEAD/DEAH box helicase domain protein [Methanohalobium evestigatum Z-7303]|uniref:DEAD/DEAH box helicase domain protein n=1 Tax=Methanohalobium evestigatum (strain ATCC BAA-1072 / DSM 3721 / NBRC 107634 / OCM 161 / Z-7303) TaxID=644295 RepID=D7EA63_METEZ|nr:DUF5814 domain-containing protein [Methanohalobium evestigatum]ADI74734.1 DEAD/DEAH box helicase domain protein [Methanohalobium evestigatum Z-7303]
MTLWTVVSAQKSKFKVMPIKNKKKVPIFLGELILGNTSAGPRPHKFKVYKEGKGEYRSPEEFVDLLRMSNRIMVVNGEYDEQESDFFEMLKGYQLKGEYVNACRHCLLKNRFNFVNKKSIRYHNELICEDCAKGELENALNNAQYRYSEEAIEHLKQLLIKTRDFDRTLGMLNPETIDSDLTRYDTIESNPDVSTIKIDDIPINKKFKQHLQKKSEYLLPVQSLSVQKGLLDGNNQLVMSATATGKTLIGELAGINNVLNKRGKMLFLVPLVALANQKYDQFTKNYSHLGIKTSIRVGSSRIKTSKTASMRTTLDSDIIVGTYEGLDYVLRTGDADKLGNIGTVVIDEVHMLEDAERGHRIDGLISRLKYTVPEAQFIYLSATVANPEWFSQKLGAYLVEYEYRPVPIERHLVFSDDSKKVNLITKLVKDEYSQYSSKGYRGQSIIFTNSRKNCHRISDALPMSSAAYHAGLTGYERKKIENKFQNGELPAVVTTAALAAGVDFPASQVIFESLAMGIDWITMQEFLQMLGRAGRPDYHDRGTVVLLATPDKNYTGEQKLTEDEVAIQLLKGEMEHTGVEYGEDENMEEILASSALTTSKSDLKAIHNKFIGGYGFSQFFNQLKKYKFINQKGEKIYLTKFGKIAARHFLSVTKAFLIRDAVLAGTEPINIVTNLEFFDSVYFKHASRISRTLKVNLPARVFQGGTIDILFEGENLSKLDESLQDQIYEFAEDFLTCNCKDSPYCGCPEHKFSSKLISLRAEGNDPEEIIKQLEIRYGITAYVGDLYDYLDDVIRNLDAVEQMAKAYSKKDIAKNAYTLKRNVEGSG